MASQSPDEVLAQLQPIFEEALDQPGLKVTFQSSAANTANWDSLAHIDIIESVERRFHVKFGLGELQDLKNVGELVRLLIRKTT
jgi:acyl carrier protein